jgi:hypothetical protein
MHAHNGTNKLLSLGRSSRQKKGLAKVAARACFFTNIRAYFNITETRT